MTVQCTVRATELTAVFSPQRKYKTARSNFTKLSRSVSSFTDPDLIRLDSTGHGSLEAVIGVKPCFFLPFSPVFSLENTGVLWYIMS